MAGIGQLTFPAAVGAAASLGAIAVGPPGVGVTGLVLCGGVLLLATANEHKRAEAARAAHLASVIHEDPALEAARQQYDLLRSDLEDEIESAVESLGGSLLFDEHWFIVRGDDGAFHLEVNPVEPPASRVLVSSVIDFDRLARWMAEVGESCYVLEDEEGWAPVPPIAAAAMAELGVSRP